GVRVRNPDVAHVIDQVFRNDWREAEDLDPHRGVANSRERGAVEGFTRFGPKPLALPLPTLPIPIKLADESEKVTPVISPRRLMPEGYAVLDELPRLLDAIDHAKSSVDVQLLTYAVSGEDVTHKFTDLDDALKRAAARGVHVRMLVSDWNLDNDKIESLRELVRGSKVEIEIFTIPPFSQGFIPYARVSHAKYMVVDGQVSWVGSSNWEESYFTSTRNVGLLVEGKKFAGKLDTIFETDWASKYAKAFDVNGTYTPRKRDQ
ncbi:MAG: phospholipase D-like domain-containing protein, partial [Polyangiaceae bacterium]